MNPTAALHGQGAMPVVSVPAPRLDAALAAIEWRWNPWRERPGRAAIALVFTIGVYALVTVLLSSAVLGVLLALAAAGTLAPLLIPSQCRIDDAGVALRSAFGWERRVWADLRRARPGRDAIVMSPFTHPRRLDAFRALVLPLPAARRDEVLAAARSHWERHEL